MTAFKEQEIAKVRAQVGSGHVICGLSGGVDSSVVAVLLHKAIGDQLTCSATSSPYNSGRRVFSV